MAMFEALDLRVKFNVGFDVWTVLSDKFSHDHLGYLVLVFVHLVFSKSWLMSKEKITAMLIENK